MFDSTKGLLVLAAASAVIAGLLYEWWGRLVAGTFAACFEASPGVDCRHAAQLHAAALFALVALVLLLVAAVRAANTMR
ncbi:MAG TPA: hypothetical protein VJ727_06520 [Rhodanobacteraceae bacterium]|nr:hypothetical protein [Rhodanobacteraceae bacterium]